MRHLLILVWFYCLHLEETRGKIKDLKLPKVGAFSHKAERIPRSLANSELPFKYKNKLAYLRAGVDNRVTWLVNSSVKVNNNLIYELPFQLAEEKIKFYLKRPKEYEH